MLIKIEHLKKEYENATPLRDVCCEIEKGEVISIIGPSGTGKSTLIKCLNLLEEPTSGQIFFDGERITDPKCNRDMLRRRVGMVFQSFDLFAHLTVLENIILAPCSLLKKDRQEACDRAMELLKSVGLADKALNYPSELSGGQQQRIAIVRAMAMEPDVMLFDEPTSALDPTMVGEVLFVIRNLKKTGITMLIVTHEMSFAREISDRIFYMDEGVIYEDGAPEKLFTAPEKDKTRRFINGLKVFTWSFDKNHFDFHAMNNGIMNFAQKNMIPAEITKKLISVSEELCVQIISASIEGGVSADVALEYSPKGKPCAELTVTYGGAALDPSSSDNDIAKKIIANAVTSMTHTYDDAVNKVKVKIE